MANKEKDLAGKKPLNRSPEESVKEATGKMKTKVEPGINKEIKDIVDDILSGKLKTVMDSDVAKKIGMSKSKHKVKENVETLDEKELILGEKETTDATGTKQFTRKSDGVKNITQGGHADTVGQKPGMKPSEKIAENEGLPIEETPDNSSVESKLSEMGYDIEQDVEIPKHGSAPSEEVELDLSSVGYDVSDIDETTNEENDLVIDDDPTGMEAPGMDAPEMGMDAPEMGMDAPEMGMDTPPMEEPVPSELDADPEVGEETPIGQSVSVAEMDFDDLEDADKESVTTYESEIQSLRDNLVAELEQIGEEVLPKELQEKLQIKFEMLAEQKANVIATKKVATVIDKTNDYMEYVVKEFVEKKSKEIKNAVDSAKKVEIYENFKTLVEGLYGTDAKTLTESKRTEDFLVNVIAEMKKENDKLTKRLNESKEKVQSMECKLIFNEATKNLTLMDKEKVATFVESFEYKNPADFKAKLNIIVESFGSLKKGNEVRKPVADVPAKAPAKQNKPLNESLIDKAVKKQEMFDSNPVKDVEEIDPDSFNSYFYAN